MEGMCEADGFVLMQLPAGVIPSDIIGEISCEEAMFTALDFLFELCAVIVERRLLIGGKEPDEKKNKKAHLLCYVGIVKILTSNSPRQNPKLKKK